MYSFISDQYLKQYLFLSCVLEIVVVIVLNVPRLESIFL